jgi:WD40 repeat protein
LKRFSTSKDKVETLVPDYRVNIIGLSDDATLVAAACDDGKLRVYKTDSMELVDEIPFYAKSYSGFVKFSNDNSKLYLQGADLYFRIYDLEQNKFVYKNKYQTNEYDFCEYDEENNRLILSNFIAMTIIDLNSMGELSYISGGRIYIPKNKTIICVDNFRLYAFKFKELDELMAQAEELYGDMELTDEQKLEYHIE